MRLCTFVRALQEYVPAQHTVMGLSHTLSKYWILKRNPLLIRYGHAHMHQPCCPDSNHFFSDVAVMYGGGCEEPFTSTVNAWLEEASEDDPVCVEFAVLASLVAC